MVAVAQITDKMMSMTSMGGIRRGFPEHHDDDDHAQTTPETQGDASLPRAERDAHEHHCELDGEY
jgi:hypothetical protein